MGMLNYETLLSSYDDKLTLMQWLKKVEAALKNATATSFVLNKKGNATISFSIVFEDGTSLESGDIVLQQGESVESAYIQNGNLHLVLTNGDDLDAGNMFNGNVTINGNVNIDGVLKVNGGVEINGIDSTGEINGAVWSTITSRLSVNQSFVKAVYNFRELQFIFNCRLSNETEEDVTIPNDQAIAQYAIASQFIRSKIYAHNGNSCDNSTSQGSVAMAALFVTTNSGLPVTAASPRYVNLFHSGSASLLFYLEGGQITIPANTSYDFEARLTLAL